MMPDRDLPEPLNVLYRLKRGLSGYVSYLAACEMNQSFSEYVLYEPTLRILTARGYEVECEVKCPGVEHARIGDKKRLDFVAKRESCRFALEVKWAKSSSINIATDLLKLEAYRSTGGRAFLCVFGRKSRIQTLSLRADQRHDRFHPLGKEVIAEFGKTRYGCRMYEVK